MTTVDEVLVNLANTEIERAMISAAMTYPDRIRLVEVMPSDLYDRRNAGIWQVMRDMDALNMPVNLETIHNRLIDKGQLEDCGGFMYLVEVVNRAMPSEYPDDYCAPLMELSVRRQAVRTAQEFFRASVDRAKPINDVINEFAARIPKLVKVAKGAEHIGVYAGQHYDRMDQALKNPAEAANRVMRTGLLEFDDATMGGIRRGEAMLIIGKPGLGKTKFMHKMGYQLACNGYAGVIFQLETSQDEIMDREISRIAQIPTERLETANLTEADFLLYAHAIETLTNPDLPLYGVFGGAWNTVTLRAELTRLKAEHNITWFGLDYLRFLRDSYGKDETERENYISSNLKYLCNDLDIAGLIIHGMNKAGIASDAPALEHSGGGAGISYDCDKALFMTEHIPEKGMALPNYRTFIFRKSRRKLKRTIFHMQALADYPDFVDPVKE